MLIKSVLASTKFVLTNITKTTIRQCVHVTCNKKFLRQFLHTKTYSAKEKYILDTHDYYMTHDSAHSLTRIIYYIVALCMQLKYALQNKLIPGFPVA